jgi:WD40-like Beta Propeller Repeat/Carboxypeptidase regulatory-like domain
MQLSIKSLSLAVLCAASLSLQAQTLTEKADMHYELHAYRLAAQNYETVLARDPEETLVANKLADAYYHLNELPKAAKWYAVALRSNAIKPQSTLQYGKVLMMLAKYDDATEQFKKYRATNASVAENYIKACQFAKETEDNMPDMNISAVTKANTAASDFGATMMGDKMVWSSSRTDLKRGETSAKAWSGSESNQLFSAAIEGVSTAPFKVGFLKSDFKNGMNESNASFSADGKKVAFMRNNLDDGERISSSGGMELSIFTADIDAKGNWMNIKAFPYNGTGFSTGFPSLSPDGKTMYFASNRSGGQGGFDIYMCQNRNDAWAEPRNLGTTINSASDEITPFTDGKTLYFASDYHVGYGGFDIFKTEGIGGEIVNLGTGINSAGDDFGFVFDPSVKVGFFTSNRAGGKGKEDIYRVEKPSEIANIVLLDKGIPVKNVKVSVLQGNAQSLTQLKSGNWLLDLNDKKVYNLEIKKEGFKTKTVKIEPEFVKKSRIVEVNLERDAPVEMGIASVKGVENMPEYKGRVYDASNEDALEGVLVRATNQENNVQLETLTDKNGRFKFNLSPSNTYLITYSKELFVIGKKSIKAADLKTKNIGEYSMVPSAVTDKNALVASIEPVKQPVSRPTAVPIDYNEVSVKSAEAPVYAVQILVTNSSDVLNLSQYDDLKTVGNIYIVPESGKQKVRLGVFSSQADADAALKKVADMGIKSPYVVQEKNAKAVQNNLFTPLPKPKVQPKAVEPKPKAVEPKPLPKPIKKGKKPLPMPKKAESTPKSYSNTAVKVEEKKPVVEDKTFKVQIAAMKKAELFNDTKVAQIWKIDQVKHGDFTLFIMDGIKTLQQAKDLKAKVKTAGYSDAKVVVKDGDKFRVVD